MSLCGEVGCEMRDRGSQSLSLLSEGQEEKEDKTECPREWGFLDRKLRKKTQGIDIRWCRLWGLKKGSRQGLRGSLMLLLSTQEARDQLKLEVLP